MTDYRIELAEHLARLSALERDEILPLLEVPPQPQLGDFAFPCFKLAKRLRQAPPQIARTLAAGFEPKPAFLDRVEVVGAYLNFFLDARRCCATLVAEMLAAAGRWMASDEGGGAVVLVDYSSPNIAKPFHVGHAFTTFLGESIKRIYAHLGYRSLGLNHLGDYGTQFGKLIVAYGLWGDPAALRENAIKELTRIYVKFHAEAEARPELEEEARARFRLLEQGHAEEVALWEEFREVSLKEFMRVYERLDVSFDSFNGESFYMDKIADVVELLSAKGLLEESEGAQVVRLDEEKLPPCIILKSDGSSIYASRDLAAVLYRARTWNFRKNIYVVGIPQSMHFKQVFAVLRKAGLPCAEDCLHVGFGTVKFPSVKMSTRTGDVILLEDLLDEAVGKTRAIVAQNALDRGLALDAGEIDAIAERIGVAAVQFTFLKNGRERDIVFTWEDMLDFEGETAPYLLYAYARSRSILRKAEAAGIEAAEADLGLLGEEAEFALVKCLAELPGAVRAAAESCEPSLLSRQLILAARAFNKFYANCKILGLESPPLRAARLKLCEAFGGVLKEGLSLLGIRSVERM